MENELTKLRQRVATLEQLLVQCQQPSEPPDHFFNLSLDLMCIAGFDDYFKRLNPVWESTLGFSIQELMAEPTLQFVHPDDWGVTMTARQKLIEDQVPNHFENRYLCTDGSYRWLEWQAIARRDEQMIYAVARDVTRRKQLEESLHSSLGLYRAITHNFPNGGVYLFDHNLCYIFADGMELFAVDRTSEHIEGKTIWDVLPAETCAQVEPSYRAALEGYTTACEVEIQGCVYSTFILPIQNGLRETPLGMMLTHNITRRKQAESEVRRLNEELAQMVEERTEQLEIIKQEYAILQKMINRFEH